MITKQCQVCLNNKDINDMMVIGTPPNQIWACKTCTDRYTEIFPDDKDAVLKGCRNCADV